MNEKLSVRLLLVPATQPVQTILEEQIRVLGLPYNLSVAASIDKFTEKWQKDECNILILNCSDGKVDYLDLIHCIQSLPTILLVDGKTSNSIYKDLGQFASACVLDIADPESLNLLPLFAERQINNFADNNTDSSGLETAHNKVRKSYLSEVFLQNMGVILRARVALLDDQGKILKVNQPWIDYCKEKDLPADNFGVGRYYLELCRDITDFSFGGGPATIDGIEKVLNGSQEIYSVGYQRDPLNQQCWNHMQVERLYSDGQTWILLVHMNISTLMRYAFSLQQIHDNLEERMAQRTEMLKAANRELREEIARRAAVEQTILEERNRFLTLVDTIPNGIVEIDTNWIIIFANAEYHRMLGYPKGSLIGKCLWDILKPDPSDARQFFEKALREQPVPVGYLSRRLTLTGKYIDLKVDWEYKRDAEGNITGFDVVITDVTQQRRAEEEAQQHLDQLAHVSRVFTMSQMVSGLAHELNQPLTAIVNFAQACLYRIRESSIKGQNTLLESIEQISLQADRAGQIIRRLRDFVRRADSSRSQENINDLVGDVLGLLEIEARAHNVKLGTVLAAELPRVAVDRIQIEQVITNLVKNAMEATWDLPPELRRVTLRTEMNEAGMLQVSVTDTGKGIKAKELNQVFEPFYTTKQSGMGLGLSISRSIVEAHGGRLEAVKNAHKGMTFRFALPVAAEGGKA